MLRAEKSQEFWDLQDNQSLPPFRCYMMLLPRSPARQMSQMCTGRTTSLIYSSQWPEVQRCRKKPTQQLCFPSGSLGEPCSFLPAPCPAMTQPRTCSQRTAWFPLSKAGQAQYVGSHCSAQLTDPKATRLEGPRSCPVHNHKEKALLLFCWKFRPVHPAVSWTWGGESGITFSQLQQGCCKLPWERKRMAKGTVIF